MNKPTPWQVNSTSRQAHVATQRRTGIGDTVVRTVNARRIDFRGDWGYLCAAGLSLLTFVFLFQPWLSASGPNGKVTCDAFGRLDGITGGMTGGGNWYGDSYRGVVVSGVWAVLIGVAALTTIFAVVMYIRLRTEMLSFVVMGASAAVALFVLVEMLYLNSKVPEIRSLTDSAHGFGLGSLLQLFTGRGGSGFGFGTGSHAIQSAGLSMGAMLGGVTALAGLMCAAGTGLRKHAALADSPSLPAALPQQPAVTALAVPTPTVAAFRSVRRDDEPSSRDSGALRWSRTANATNRNLVA